MFAATYPLLDAFWIMLWFFIFVAWIWALIAIFTDIFRSRDMGGFAKALWFLFVLFIPLLGIFCYLVARGSGMHERTTDHLQQQQQAFDAYVEDRAKSAQPSNADELAKLAQLKSSGVLSDSEYESEKAKILARHAA
jgi:Phospholipase_D-nuclease N-terminal/Short C-terminal domain